MSIMDLLKEFMPFFCIPICMALFSTIIRIINNIAQGCYIADMREEIKRTEKELIKEPKRINIDEDLQKYFNYKE